MITQSLLNLFSLVTEASWQASPVILLILCIRPVLGSRVPAVWRYSLWGLVLIRLIVPLSWLPSSPVSPANVPVIDRLLQTIMPYSPTPKESQKLSITKDPVPSLNTVRVPVSATPELEAPAKTASLTAQNWVPAPATPAPVRSISWNLIGAMLWFIGVTLSLAYVVFSQILFSMRVKRGELEVPSGVLKIWQCLCQRLGVVRRPRLMASSAVHSPALSGFFRPTLILPAELKGYTTAEYEHVFAHELGHFKRGDHLTHAVQVGMVCLHWFNPLVWLGFWTACIDRELAADEWALRHLSSEAPVEYGETLLKIVASHSRSTSTLTVIGIVEDARQLKGRLRRIISFRPQSRMGSFVGATAVLGVSVLVLSQGLKAQDTKTPENTSPVYPGGTLTVQVVDENNKPVIGAKVQPTNIYLNVAMDESKIWDNLPKDDQGECASFTTNEEGKVSLPIPPLSHPPTAALELTIRDSRFALDTEKVWTSEKSRIIQLSKGAVLTLQAKGPDGSILSGLLVQSDNNGDIKWHRSEDGKSMISDAPLAIAGYRMRGLVLDSNGKPMFSDYQNIVIRKEGEISATFDVKPGVSLHGVLDPAVPRPVKHGWVQIFVARSWGSTAAVADDGTFSFDSLPLGPFKIIAKCDGFTSQQPQDVEKNTIHRWALSFPFVTAVNSPLTLPMEADGAFEIHVVDPDNRPLAGAKVWVQPREMSDGSSFLGETFANTLGYLEFEEDPDKTHADPFKNRLQPYVVFTDSSGLAVFNDLPTGSVNPYNVYLSGYKEPTFHPSPKREITAFIQSGKTTQVEKYVLVPESAKDAMSPAPVCMIDGQPVNVQPTEPDPVPFVDAPNVPAKSAEKGSVTIRADSITQKTNSDGSMTFTAQGGQVEVTTFPKDGVDYDTVHRLGKFTNYIGGGPGGNPYNYGFDFSTPESSAIPDGAWVKLTSSYGKVAYVFNCIDEGGDTTLSTNLCNELGWEPQDPNAVPPKINYQLVPAGQVPPGPWIPTKDDAATFVRRRNEYMQFVGALNQALYDGKYDKVKELWEANPQSPQYCLRMTYAISQDHPISELETLLAKGEPVQAPLGDMDPVIMACTKGNIEAYKWLVAHGANPRLVQDDGYSELALTVAARAHQPEMVAYLISNGASCDSNNMNGLMDGPDNKKVIDLMVKSGGITPTSSVPENASALHFACDYGGDYLVETMLKQGFSPLSKFDDRNRNPMVGKTVLQAVSEEAEKDPKLASKVELLKKAVSGQN